MDNEKVRQTEYFPDGTPIDDWFYETKIPQLSELGKQYVLTEYGIWDDGKIYTKEIQKVIDLVAEEGGGVLVVRNLSDRIDLFQTGSASLYFRRSYIKGQQ